MSKYRIDIRIVGLLENVEVEIDDSIPQADFRSQLIAAGNTFINERLAMLDIKGGRSGSDGFLSSCSVQALVNWDKQS
jgi:hypothetical protein